MSCSEKRVKLWTVTQITMATYLAGPLTGCYCLGRNYKAFGFPELAKRCYLVGALSSLVLFFVCLLLPESLLEGIPHHLISLACGLSVMSFAMSYQKERVGDALKEKGKRHSYFWMLWLVFWFILLEFLFAFLVVGSCLYFGLIH